MRQYEVAVQATLYIYVTADSKEKTRELAVAAVSEIPGVMDGIEFETEGTENVMLATLEHEASVDLAEE